MATVKGNLTDAFGGRFYKAVATAVPTSKLQAAYDHGLCWALILFKRVHMNLQTA